VHNRIPLFLEETALLLKGFMVIGRPGYGKSSAVYYYLDQVTTPYLALDPKASWKPASIALRNKYIDWDNAYFCLRPPKNITWEHWLFVLSDVICQATGLQYSQDLIIEAGQICLRQNTVRNCLVRWNSGRKNSKCMEVKSKLPLQVKISANILFPFLKSNLLIIFQFYHIYLIFQYFKYFFYIIYSENERHIIAQWMAGESMCMP